MFRLIINEQEYQLKRGYNYVGRGPENHINVIGIGVSADHLLIVVNDRGVEMDNFSRSTWLNGDRLRLGSGSELVDGDVLQIGSLYVHCEFVGENLVGE